MSPRDCRRSMRPGGIGARRISWLALLLFVACARPPGIGMEAITGATVIDVISGRTLPDAVILIRDGHVVAVGTAGDLSVPHGATTTDLTGRWIIPGLIDAHAHLQPWGLAAALHWGVTSVRDLHDGMTLADTLLAIASRSVSPRLFLAHAMLDTPPMTYADALPVPAPDSAAPQVARLAASGATWIKVYSHVTPEILEAVVAAARTRQLPVAAHLGLTDAITAAQLGVASIEHLSGVPEAAGDSVALFEAHRQSLFRGWTAFERSWVTLDTVKLGEVALGLVATHVVLVPTLGLHDTFSRLDDSASYRSPDLAIVPDSARRNWNVPGMIKRAGWTRADFPVFRAARRVQDWFVATFVRAGGRVATGTDASNQLLVPGAGVHLEMELLVHAGLSPLEALRAGTLWAADLLSADSLGRLRPGTAADLVVLGGDPLVDIRNTRRVVRVMIGGSWVARK